MGNRARGSEKVTSPLHVAVLMGGWSSDREVSLVSGAGIADALEKLGHRVTRIVVGRDVAERIAETKARMEARSVGKECVRTINSRCSCLLNTTHILIFY